MKAFKNKKEEKNYRIGNLVYLTNTGLKEQKVIPLEHYDFEHIVHKRKAFRFEPIPLTEQWLIDLGFEKNILSDDSGYYYTLELNEGKYCDLAIVSGDKNGFVEATLFPYEEWFRYKYVHDLQNLFFALTGSELEYKKQQS